MGNTNRVSNSLDPDQDQHSVGPDLGPNCLQRLFADDNVLSVLIWVQTVCKGYQQMKKVAVSTEGAREPKFWNFIKL